MAAVRRRKRRRCGVVKASLWTPATTQPTKNFVYAYTSLRFTDMPKQHALDDVMPLRQSIDGS